MKKFEAALESKRCTKIKQKKTIKPRLAIEFICSLFKTNNAFFHN